MYKTYKFALCNINTGPVSAMYIYRDFPSAYAAQTRADRLTFKTRGPYMLIVEFGEETPCKNGMPRSGWRRSA